MKTTPDDSGSCATPTHGSGQQRVCLEPAWPRRRDRSPRRGSTCRRGGCITLATSYHADRFKKARSDPRWMTWRAMDLVNVARHVSSCRVIDLFRYITDAPAPMTSVARIQENALLSGDLARMTREEWRTKCRRRPRRGAESLRSSHAVDSVGIERRVSQPRAVRALPRFLESFSPNHHCKGRFLGLRRPKSLAQSAQSNSDFRS